MMRKRNMLSLPLVAAMVALMAASAFAVAPVIDDLPRVVVNGATFNNAVNLDAFINWFPVTAGEPWGANRDYVGVPSTFAGYGAMSRFHVYVFDARSQNLTNDIDAGQKTAITTLRTTPGPLAAPPAVAAERYGVAPYSDAAGTALDLVYTTALPAGNSGTVDVYALVEGAANGGTVVASWAPMTVAQGAANTTAFSIGMVSDRAADSFYYWIPRSPALTADFSPVTPLGLTGTWANQALRDTSGVVGWDASMDVPTGKFLNLGIFTGAAQVAGVAYANFIPQNGGGVTAPVFQLKARLLSGAPTVAESPGYRVSFMNGGFTHLGILQVYNDQLNQAYGYAGAGAGLRNTSSNDFVARCYWTTPSTATEMADGGRIARFGTADPLAVPPVTATIIADDPTDPVYLGLDGRNYGVEIMLIDRSDSTGVFVVDSLSVTTLLDGGFTLAATPVVAEWNNAATPVAPAVQINATTWGIGYFDDDNNRDTPYLGMYGGDGKIENNALLLWGSRDARTDLNANLTTQGTLRVVKASPTGNFIPVVSNKLYRTTFTMASRGMSDNGNVVLSPVTQVHFMSIPATLDMTTASRIGWYETWGPAAPYLKDPAVRGQSDLTPGVPLATATAMKAYVFSHNVPASAHVLVPEIYVYNTGIYHATPWTDAFGFYRVTGVKMEQLDNYNNGTGAVAFD